MNKLLKKILLVFLFFLTVNAQAENFSITVKAGDNQALIDAINEINAKDSLFAYFIYIETGPNGETGFEFTEAYESTNNALPTITSRIVFVNRLNDRNSRQVSFTGTGQNNFRLVSLKSFGSLNFRDSSIQDFGVTGENGGAILVTDNGQFASQSCHFKNNFSNMNGGAIASTDKGSIIVSNSEFVENRSSNVGGAISIEGQAGAHFGFGRGNFFRNNFAGVFGCDLNFQTAGIITLENNVFEGGNCENVSVENPFGEMRASANTFTHAGNAIDSTAIVQMLNNVFRGPSPGNQPLAVIPVPAKPQAACNDFGSGAFNSLGHNISSDESCSLSQPTDLPNTDPMLSTDEGAPTPLPGSPAIDHGPAGLVTWEGDSKPSLPCGYGDVTGLGRPQDGDGDGGFECDSGAIEAPGAGAVVAGHSAAFYNALRNGEGQYVEILEGGVAVIYTFTYRPDGSGPAWLLGVANVAGNSLVADELDRPVGTSFGASFEADDIDFSDWGGMSMVFPDCEATGAPGNIAYSGSPELDYEALITRAERVTHIAGCGSQMPHANAGLSGSWYDPARNGEGLVIQWLPDGSVLAIMFTYDTNGNQMWIFGVGQSDGKTVTIDALYPTGFTSWGSSFDMDQVVLEPWGTFTLTWTDCNTLAFEYTSEVSGYGSAARGYSRLTSLSGLACPDFE